MKFSVNLEVVVSGIIIEAPDEQNAVIAATERVHRAIMAAVYAAGTSIEDFEVKAVHDA